MGGDEAVAAEEMDRRDLRRSLEIVRCPTQRSSGAVEKELAPLVVTDVMITSWAKNPYTKGAWSYVPVNSSAEDIFNSILKVYLYYLFSPKRTFTYIIL